MKKIIYTTLLLVAFVSCKEKAKKTDTAPQMETVTEEVTKISFEMTPKSNSTVKGICHFLPGKWRTSHDDGLLIWLNSWRTCHSLT